VSTGETAKGSGNLRLPHKRDRCALVASDAEDRGVVAAGDGKRTTEATSASVGMLGSIERRPVAPDPCMFGATRLPAALTDHCWHGSASRARRSSRRVLPPTHGCGFDAGVSGHCAARASSTARVRYDDASGASSSVSFFNVASRTSSKHIRLCVAASSAAKHAHVLPFVRLGVCCHVKAGPGVRRYLPAPDVASDILSKLLAESLYESAAISLSPFARPSDTDQIYFERD